MPVKSPIPPTIADAPVDVTQNLTYRIVVLANALNRSASRMLLDGAGISVPEWRVVALVGSQPTISFNGLAQALDVDKGWISRTVAQLEANGLLQREPDPVDRRQFTLKLTRAGRALHLKGSGISVKRQKMLAAQFSPEELQTLGKLLDRLKTAADQL